MNIKTVTINSPGGSLSIGNDRPLTIIAGPCQMESRAHALEVASALKEIAQKAGLGLIYKSSFDKANRTSVSGRRGIGLKESLPVFAEIRESLGLPTLTDIHEIEHCAPVAEAVDVLQIPAFLCRQTDLLLAAGKTNAVINVKKGQFLAPWDMAAGSLLILEAGGLVSDFKGESGFLDSGRIVGGTPKVFGQLLPLIAAHSRG